MNELQNDDEQKLGRMLQQLVSMLQLDSGHVRMNVHQGTIPFIDIVRRVRIPIDPRSSPDSRADEAREIMTCGAEIFARTKLQPLVKVVLGPYGRVVAKVEAGNVAGFRLVRKLRNGDEGANLPQAAAKRSSRRRRDVG